ncbi:hypothetical protein MRX96_033867 [Rhipicephalus microplus]
MSVPPGGAVEDCLTCSTLLVNGNIGTRWNRRPSSLLGLSWWFLGARCGRFSTIVAGREWRRLRTATTLVKRHSSYGGGSFESWRSPTLGAGELAVAFTVVRVEWPTTPGRVGVSRLRVSAPKAAGRTLCYLSG